MNTTKPVNSAIEAFDWWERLSNRRWILHVLYWSFIVLFFGLFWGSVQGNYRIMLISEVVLLPSKLITVYLILYFLIPRYLLRQRYLGFTLLALIIVVLAGTLQRGIAFYFLGPWKAFDPSLAPFNVYEIMHQIVNINTAMVIPIGVNLLTIWTNKKLEAKDLERQSIEN